MTLILTGITFFLVGGFGAFLSRNRPIAATRLGVGGVVVGSILGLIGTLPVLFSASPVEAIRLPWSIPFGTFYLEIDALSAFFLIPIYLLSALSAIYGSAYLEKNIYQNRLGSHWAFFSILIASMVLVVIARNGMLFLIAWEAMALASFFLVMLDRERESVQRAGWIYLVSTHIGTVFLYFFFVLIGDRTGSLDFDVIASSGAQIYPQATLFFILALIGFGAKAGIVPLHIWLPEAHPAAPSHVSAVMSGIMIKTGIYGIIRTLSWFGTPPLGWAVALILIGCVSGVLGVLLALAQHDLKRLLAYHSVENIGIIFLGLGIGVLGQSTGLPMLIVLGYGGALLHTLNHALFKGLLFLGAGSVLHGSHTLDIEHTGGLLKRMPWTGMAFLIGAVAICGLPPLNGFISEFMIYSGAFQGIFSLNSLYAIPVLLTIVALALIGGLAALCFTKAFGIVFLGHPRSQQASDAHEVSAAMRWTMVVLATLCLVIGLSAPLMMRLLEPVLAQMIGVMPETFLQLDSNFIPPLQFIVGTSLLLIALVAVLYWLIHRKQSNITVTTAVTWDCGYAKPEPQMQYTASSFAQPLIDLIAKSIRLKADLRKPIGYFPVEGGYTSEIPDLAETQFWTPIFKGIEWVMLRFRWIQTGSIHLYILYITITLIVLLIWKLG